MKIPKSLKLPRKLKKEVKKGFNRNIKSGVPITSFDAHSIVYYFYQVSFYTGSNTKSFRRLCKYAMKEEKRVYEKMFQEEMCKQIYKTYVDNVPIGLRPAIDNIIQMQREINKNETVVPDFWKDTTVQIKAVFPLNNKTIAGRHEY